jgi:hypothetical protein
MASKTHNTVNQGGHWPAGVASSRAESENGKAKIVCSKRTSSAYSRIRSLTSAAALAISPSPFRNNAAAGANRYSQPDLNQF